ncbi:Phospholipid N-methyltransferase [Streptomyces zhaozhouensis]|uniref:Phospholipid N-methyltransferase n=1 Tax=Streptomyces zhaozhouensis TaxID=1300267 RepID=A0A286DIA2_9ACTN|nr:methyltransferase domain-containing protein [Streptomyces zhaozhouensis]SOD58329.1 Phospholipid N-methyltransferase [Streptomyces zhaozhouensis]
MDDAPLPETPHRFPNPARSAAAPCRVRSAGRWAFLLEAARDLQATGAVAPSGRALASALTLPLRERRGRAANVLEVGAGTGAVTRVLLARLPSGSRLDVVEANPRFADRLHRLPRPAGRDVRVHIGRVEELLADVRYDVIVSGLPFANFPTARVTAIMDRYLELLRPGGVLTYFAYRGTRRARALVASRAEAMRHLRVEEELAAYHDRCAARSRTVWGNLPPARVWRLTAPAPTGQAAAATALSAV